MQSKGNSGCFPRGNRAAIVRRHLASFFLLCVKCFRVSIPPAGRLALLRQMDMGSLTCAHIWVSVTCAHIWVSAGTNKSWQELTGRDRKNRLFFTLLRQRIEPRVCGFESWHFNHWATSPVSILSSRTYVASDAFNDNDVLYWFPRDGFVTAGQIDEQMSDRKLTAFSKIFSMNGF